MLNRIRSICAIALLVAPAALSAQDAARWRQEAQRVTIIRDSWGIAHVYGHTDADAVFGMIYAQAEDDFNRVETNYLNSLGWAAQAEGESAVYRDLRQRLFINTDTLKAMYATSPDWLKALMNAWADGLNFYLSTHCETKPKVITRFEPWMALSFTEGSIGGDIETIDLAELEKFYGGRANAPKQVPDGSVEPGGSNGIAIAPANTANHHALLLINPHTTFFFRSELQMVSDEGLDAYGAVTWGQFFVYQGFNERAGWMHTSSNVDNIDEYAETIVKRGSAYAYRYGSATRPVTTSRIVIPYKTASGTATREFTVYRTQHGPVVRSENGKWITVSLMNVPVRALTQSYTRTKARTLKEFEAVLDLHSNSSNNTIYANADGDIAYFHANFIPRRDTSFDWTMPVDGSNPRTDWGPVLSLDQSPNAINPATGWVYNSNDWPWMAAGPYSPRREDYPAYVERGGPSPRGRHAVRVLEGRHDFSIESLRAAAYDSYLPAFDDLLPPLFEAYEELPGTDPRKAALAEQVATLKNWDRRWSVESVPTTLAVYYGQALNPRSVRNVSSGDQYLAALAAASAKLSADFGTWKTPWSEVNRFQRLTADIQQPFNDTQPSIPVGFTSARWGSLASFAARTYPGTKRMYGTSGNSFVAVVEFGDSVRAIAVTAGGESGHVGSPHFNDQAERYATGNLRQVWFYRPDVEAHAERTYHP
jgi:acyl-homoserine-lactone acylase